MHIRQRGACAPKRLFDVRASAPLCGWLSCSCGTAAGAATPLRSFRPKKGATPHAEGLVRARGRARFHALAPAPWGRSRAISPLAGRPSSADASTAPAGGFGGRAPRSRDSGKERLTSTGNARSAALAVRRYLTPPYTKRKMPPKGGTPGSYQVMTSFPMVHAGVSSSEPRQYFLYCPASDFISAARMFRRAQASAFAQTTSSTLSLWI